MNLIKNTLGKIFKWALTTGDRRKKDRRQSNRGVEASMDYISSPVPVSYNLNSTKSAYPVTSYPTSVNSLNHDLGSDALHFSVYSANGGKIVKLQKYDPRTDVTNTKLHVITKEMDLGDELNLIIMQECLAR